MRLTHRRPLALCAAAALALAAPAVAAAHGSGHGHDDHHGKGLRAIKRIVVIYEENHSFDNLYGGWEGVNGLRRRRRRAHDAGQPGRRALHVPAAERRQPGDAAAQPRRAPTRRPRRPSRATSPTRRSRSTTASRRRTTTCPAPGVFAAQRRAQRHRPARRLHARPRAPLLPGAVPAQRRQAGPLHDRQRRRRPDQGYYDTRALPIYKYLHAAGHPHYAIADDFFQAAFGGSFLNHQWLVAAATPTWPDDGRRRPALGRRRQRDADHYPLYNSPATPATDTALTASRSTLARPARVKDGALTAAPCRPPPTPPA